MDGQWIVRVPFPISVNTYYRRIKNQGRSARGKQYAHDVADALRKQFGPPPEIDCMLAMQVYLFPGDQRKRDIDNCYKSLLDCLMRPYCLYKDDSQIKRLTGEMCEVVSRKESCAILVINELEDFMPETLRDVLTWQNLNPSNPAR